MKLLSTAFSTSLITSLALAGCVDSELDEITEDQAADDAEAVAPTKFTLQAKSFIAPIPDNMVGSLGPLFDENLYAFAGLTNLSFSENPQTGAQSAAQFRVWSQLSLSATCSGSNVTGLTVTAAKTDVGFESLLKGEIDPIQSRSSLVRETAGGPVVGNFTWQASGRPNILAEPAFLFVHPRTNRTIWYRVDGKVTCSGGVPFVGSFKVVNTDFPSVRIWAIRDAGAEQLVYQEAQGKFTALWSLPNVPRF